MSDAASDRLPRGPERRGAVGRTGAVVDAGRRETTRRTYTRNGNLGSDVSVILKETFDMITGDGRSCATRAILEVPSPGSARGPDRVRTVFFFRATPADAQTRAHASKLSRPGIRYVRYENVERFVKAVSSRRRV